MRTEAERRLEKTRAAWRSGGQCRALLHAEECIFDQVAQFVEILVISSCDLAIDTGRDDRFHSGVSDTFDNGIGIVATIGQEGVGLQA